MPQNVTFHQIYRQNNTIYLLYYNLTTLLYVQWTIPSLLYFHYFLKIKINELIVIGTNISDRL